MTNTIRGTEDFPTLDAAIRALTDRGFVKASTVGEHYRHPVRMDDGYWQRADVFEPHNMDIGRVSFWPSNA